MGEIIQYEGVAYKKVDRKAQEGDVVMVKGYRRTTRWALEPGIIYPVTEVIGQPAINVNGYIVHVYEGPWNREDYSTVANVYERSPEHDLFIYAPDMPNVQTGTIECEKVRAMQGLQHFTDTPAPESELEKRMRHLEHPFYREARECWQFTQQGQIRKGSEKYPEPFNPDSWSASELLGHAMQENVDQAHYIYGLYTKMYEMEKELKELREFRDQVQKTVVKWGAVNEPESGDA